MARLPQPRGDDGTWGDVLNDYLSVSHDATGVLHADSIIESQLAPAVRTKLNTVGVPSVGDWTSITGKPTTFAPSAHVHAITDVTGLQSALDVKIAGSALAPVATTGSYADLTAKPSIPAQFTPVAGANIAISGAYPNLIIAATAVAPVSSVNAKTGAVALTQDDIPSGTTNASLSVADKERLAATSGANTGDQVSVTGNAGTATKLATPRTINGVAFDGSANIVVADTTKEPVLSPGTATQYYRGDKTWQTLDRTAIGLGNVDNTLDINKPISTLTQQALNAKADTAMLGAKVLLIDNAAALPAGTPAGVIVIVKG